MAEVIIDDNNDFNPSIPFVIDGLFEIYYDNINNWFVLKEQSTGNVININGIDIKLPAQWPPQ